MNWFFPETRMAGGKVSLSSTEMYIPLPPLSFPVTLETVILFPDWTNAPSISFPLNTLFRMVMGE